MSILFWIIFILIIILLILVSVFLFKKGKVEKEIKSVKRERYEYLASIEPKSLDLGVEYKEEPVPKKIYRTWCTTETEKDCGGRRFDPNVIEKTKLTVPDWKQIIYTDEDIEGFLNTEFGKNHPVTQAYHLLNPAYGAARADLFRYLVIYKYGGLYLDMKSCVVGLLPVMPEDKNIWVSTWRAQKHLFKDGEYQNWYIYARKGSPVLKRVIERVVHNIFKIYKNPDYDIDISYDSSPSKSLVLSVTGPVAFTMAVENSKDKGVHYDNHINRVLQYNCGKFGIVSNSHYSKQSDSLVLAKINIVNSLENGELPSCFKTPHEEIGEREVADKFTKSDACVLEIGGGAGNVSTVIQRKLSNPYDHVVIQPGEGGMYGGLQNLRKNREACNSKFHIIDHILKPGEGDDLLKLVSKPFDTIVCDCEGCLYEEYKKNPILFKHVNMIQVERDDRKIEKNSYKEGKYDPLFKKLGMRLLHKGDGCGRDCDTDVWVRD